MTRLREAKTADGRDPQGRFLPGCKGGPGRTPSASVHEHRAALVEAVSPQDIADIVGMLVAQAKAGDLTAARIVLERVLGKPVEGDLLERVETLERALLDGDAA